ncbi:MAG: CPBP family intramembrane metalloprotease [Clostridia bacterium]|nr:CPBP family intramembrane metalloprotease [Clostridia bacterium]
MRYINVERTKMVDEASTGHTPTPLFVSIMRFILVFFLGTILGNLLAAIPLGIYLLTGTDLMEIIGSVTAGTMNEEQYIEAINVILLNIPPIFTVISLICTASSIVAAVFYCRYFEKRRLPSMGFRKGKAGLEYLVGALIGLGMYAVTFLIAWATGSVSIELNPEGFAPIILLFLVGYIIQGASEEILLRGYFMITLARDMKPWSALMISSLMFSLLHAFNPGVSVMGLINIMLFGMFMGIYVFKRGNIWGACAIHTFWNFAQGNIFGSYVSGTSLAPSVFVTSYNPDRLLANGGAFGLEGGAAATIILVLAIGITLFTKTNKKELSVLEQPLFDA